MDCQATGALAERYPDGGWRLATGRCWLPMSTRRSVQHQPPLVNGPVDALCDERPGCVRPAQFTTTSRLAARWTWTAREAIESGVNVRPAWSPAGPSRCGLCGGVEQGQVFAARSLDFALERIGEALPLLRISGCKDGDDHRASRSLFIGRVRRPLLFGDLLADVDPSPPVHDTANWTSDIDGDITELQLADQIGIGRMNEPDDSGPAMADRHLHHDSGLQHRIRSHGARSGDPMVSDGSQDDRRARSPSEFALERHRRGLPACDIDPFSIVRARLDWELPQSSTQLDQRVGRVSTRVIQTTHSQRRHRTTASRTASHRDLDSRASIRNARPRNCG